MIIEWINWIWTKENRWMWYGLILFGIASTFLAWQFMPYAIFEAILDPVIVALMVYETIRRKIKENK